MPAGEGKKIEIDDHVEVSPATVKREEHGFIKGKVVAVSELPATKLAMEAALEHPELVDAFLKRYAPGVLLRVHVKLDWIAITRRQRSPVGPARIAGTISLVVVVGAGPAAQDRHDVPGGDRRRKTKADQPDSALDQDGRRV